MYMATNTHILVPEFDYRRTGSLSEVLALAAEHGDRARLIALKYKQQIGASLSVGENGFLWSLARRYRVKDGDLGDLLVRVDVIPPSLALAQAIEESGWGTSVYARKGNALFGQEADGKSTNAMAGRIGRRFDGRPGANPQPQAHVVELSLDLAQRCFSETSQA